MITFAFETIGLRRLEVRAAMKNDPSVELLRKLGVLPGGMLRTPFLPDHAYLDRMLWTILDDQWQAKVIWGGGKLH